MNDDTHGTWMCFCLNLKENISHPCFYPWPVRSSRVEQAGRQTGTAGDHPFGLGWIFGKASGQRLSSAAAAVALALAAAAIIIIYKTREADGGRDSNNAWSSVHPHRRQRVWHSMAWHGHPQCVPLWAKKRKENEASTVMNDS